MKKILILFTLVLVFGSCKEHNSDGDLNLFSSGWDYNDRNSLAFGANANKLDVESILEDQKSVEVDKNSLKTGERKLIKNGRVAFEVNDLERTKKQIVATVSHYKGYISSDSQNELSGRINNHLTIRIPFQNFDSLLIGISKEIEKFDTKEIRISDVTEEFLDVQSRLKNKKALEKRYLEILKKAKTVDEILNVEKEIGKLREDIESAEGKLKYLTDQVSFSTLNVLIYKEISNESSFGKKLKNGLKDGYEGIKSFILFLISNWPLVILVILILLWIRRRRRKRKK